MLMQRNSACDKRELDMLNPDAWHRKQAWQLLWQGPGAVSTFWSMPLALVGAALSLAVHTGPAWPGLSMPLANVSLSALLILIDELRACRNHDLGLLRFSAARSRDRIAKLGIRSKQIDRFVYALWLSPELKYTFKNSRLESVELMVLGLDLLSQIASRYGRCGRRVFEANQDPIVGAMRLFECMSFAEAEQMLVEPLRTWLQDPPEYDPEGWAVSIYGES
jgi:hypothetical protein